MRRLATVILATALAIGAWGCKKTEEARPAPPADSTIAPAPVEDKAPEPEMVQPPPLPFPPESKMPEKKQPENK